MTQCINCGEHFDNDDDPHNLDTLSNCLYCQDEGVGEEY